MERLTERQVLALKTEMVETMSNFTEKMSELGKTDNIGWMPDNLEVLMADAALAVLFACAKTNHYIENEGLAE